MVWFKCLRKSCGYTWQSRTKNALQGWKPKACPMCKQYGKIMRFEKEVEDDKETDNN